MDEIFDKESIWAFKVEYKPSRITAEVEEVAAQQAVGVKAADEESQHDGNRVWPLVIERLGACLVRFFASFVL